MSVALKLNYRQSKSLFSISQTIYYFYFCLKLNNGRRDKFFTGHAFLYKVNQLNF